MVAVYVKSNLPAESARYRYEGYETLTGVALTLRSPIPSGRTWPSGMTDKSKSQTNPPEIGLPVASSAIKVSWTAPDVPSEPLGAIGFGATE